jgi:serine/threonine protein kinase
MASEIAESVNFPHILKLWDVVCVYSATFRIVSELGEQSLAKKLSKAIQITHDQVYKPYHDIVCGIEFLHSIKIAHLDLKLENIILVNEVVKIGDFGASYFAEDDDPMLTRRWTTGAFTPPEYAESMPSQPSPPYNAFHVDLWSLGIVFLQMVHCKYLWLGAPTLEDPNFCDWCTDPMTVKPMNVIKRTCSCAVPFILSVLNVDVEKRPTIEWIRHYTLHHSSSAENPCPSSSISRTRI